MRFLVFILLFSINFISFSQNFLRKEDSWNLKSPLNFENYSYEYQFYHDSTFYAYRKNMNLELAPHIEFAQQGSNGIVKSGVNLNFFGTYVHRLDLFITYNGGYINAPNSIYESPLQAKSFFLLDHGKNNYSYHDLRTRIIYKYNKNIQFQTGIDKHKIGEGDRSLLLGDQGIANPFALLKFNFWKLEYINLQQIYREGRTGHYVPKGNASHFINFKPSKRFSFGIFETVTHLIKDTLYNRGYDVEYLNPFIFYRPQEYSLGSTDNVIMGINTHYTFKNTMIYGQFVLDEFLLSELRSRNRWWGNKYGGQIGFKTRFNLFQNEALLRSELNIVRPYTYSHNRADLSYSNQGLPSAHPLGSNFVEWYNELNFSIKKVKVNCWTQWYMKGVDSLGVNTSFGGDIYKDYTLKPLGKDTLYYIGSGTKSYRLQVGVNISRLITKYRWECYLEPRFFITKQKTFTTTNFYITVGIRSRLFGDRRNY